MKLAIGFTNFGPYHQARLRALGERLRSEGGELIAHELASVEQRYPWLVDRENGPYSQTTLFPGRAMEDVSSAECRDATTAALDRDNPDAVAICGYARPESMAALRWAEAHRRPTILMSESQKIDHPRTWWKETIKRGRVRRFSAALVGGPRHRDYLIDLGMPADRISLGYNAVDNQAYAKSSTNPPSKPDRPYFLAVNRFVPEKNLVALIRAFAAYRSRMGENRGWDLVLCGGGASEPQIAAEAIASGWNHAIHFPGFLQAGELASFYHHAGGFIHPSRLEPWGLVVNEAAACGVPLLVSERAGCVETLVPDPSGTTGMRIDPSQESSMTSAMIWLASITETERLAIGRRASEVVSRWGPGRFASGMMEALEASKTTRKTRPERISGSPQ